MTINHGYRLQKPTHPGSFVRTIVLEPLDMTITEAARKLGVTRAALSNLLNGNASLSPDMAIRLDKAFGIDMETMMRMQNSHDIMLAKTRWDDVAVAA